MTGTLSKLVSPMQFGSMPLQHRVAFAPCTRRRCPENIPVNPLMATYYAQRASCPGTFLITEGTMISQRQSGMSLAPGIWSAEQISAWKEITDAVHEKGSFICCQLFAMGRAAPQDELDAKGVEAVSSSAIPLADGRSQPREASEQDIWDIIGDFEQAARNAVEAGFDAVEIHGANGYLVDQFTQDTCNKRTDAWGGSVEKRARFGVEVAKAVAKAIGPEKVGYRVSPFSTFQDMGIEDPVSQFGYLASELSKLNLLYLHAVEARIAGAQDVEVEESLEFALEAWGKEKPVIIAGGYKPATAIAAVDGQYKDYNVLIAFGRYFISNPDLPYRIQRGIEPSPYNRATFYTDTPLGYADYPFSSEYLLANPQLQAQA